MRTNRHSQSKLKTATAIADPVLLRLSTGRGVLVLLASDMTYDKAGAMRLHQVRWARSRAARELFSTNRLPLTGRQSELLLRQMSGYWVGTLTQHALVRAPATRRGMSMTNLSLAQYQAYRATTPRRLMIAANQMAPRPSAPVTKALRTLHLAASTVKRIALNTLYAKIA